MMRHVDAITGLRDAVTAAVRRTPAEGVRLDQAAGRWLAAPVRAARPAPSTTCSAMDGYAVRAQDTEGPAPLSVRATLFAGQTASQALAPGEAARIYTGAPLPPGADSVVRSEAAREVDGRVAFSTPARPGENVRRAGEDVAAGGLALPRGVRLGARQRALLRAVGAEVVEVHRRPRVRILSTGDEIASGQTPDSNGLAVAGACERAGAEVSVARVADVRAELRAALAGAPAAADLVITVGGVSVGLKDLVPEVLGELGAEVRIHGVPMKPGKPFLFALLGGAPVLGLPGSPSACLVAFEVFARPALLAASGAARLTRPEIVARLAEPVAGRAGRARLLWAALEPDGRVRPVGRDAAQVRGPALADALLHLPAGTGELPEGAEVRAWVLGED